MARARQLVASLELSEYYSGMRRDAQELLPHLVRKLISGTTIPGSLGLLRMASGDDIRLHGWDGAVVLETDHPFVPRGNSAWEMGVASEPEVKADADYAKRSKDTLGVSPSDATFVFVTPHVWAGKETWARARRTEGTWKDVRVIDGQVLAEWLEIAPVVAAWFLRERGIPVDDIDDVSSGWMRLVEEPLGSRTVSSGLVIGGRVAEAATLGEWFASEGGDLGVHGETAEEAAIFVLAVLRDEDSRADSRGFSRRVLVARSVNALHYLAGLHSPHFVITMDSSVAAELRVARRNHVRLIQCSGRPAAARMTHSHGAIVLPPLKREVVQRELLGFGCSEQHASKIAGGSRGSLNAVLLGMGSRTLDLLPWCQQPAVSQLAPLVLVRRWLVKECDDHAAIGKLAQRQYPEVVLSAQEWRRPDGPLHVSGECWDWKAWSTAWDALAPHFTEDLIGRFVVLAEEVLGTTEPALELPPGDRWKAAALGKRHPYSKALRDGIVHSTAMFGTASERGLKGIRDVAGIIVRRLLAGEPRTRRWLSLAHWLPDLAEAAPDTFLETAEQLASDSDAIGALWGSPNEMSSSGHVHLLWALERLAWNAQLLPRVIVLLGRLAMVAPEVKSGNSPVGSIHGILLPWMPGTAAGSVARLAAFDCLKRQCPDVAWKCALRFVPSTHEMRGPLSKPEFRPWAAGVKSRPSKKERSEFVDGIAERILDMAGQDCHRWTALLDELPDVFTHVAHKSEAFLSRLESLDRSGWPADGGRSFWEKLCTLIQQHTEYPDAPWTMKAPELERLIRSRDAFAPKRLRDQHRRLFSISASMPGRKERTWQEEKEELAAARKKVVESLLASEGLGSVLEWHREVDAPGILGSTMGECELTEDDEKTIIESTLFSAHPGDAQTLRQLGHGFVCVRERVRGREWGRVLLQALSEQNRVADAIVVALALDPRPPLWEAIDAMNPELAREYWKRMGIPYLNLDEAELAVPRLLAVGRPYGAISLVGTLCHLSKSEDLGAAGIATLHALCVRVTETVPDHGPETEPGAPSLQWLAPSLAGVLNFLETHATNASEVTARLFAWEWHWLPVLEHSGRGLRTLTRELSRSPEFFVELLTLLYRKRNGEQNREVQESQIESDKQATMRADQAWRLLEAWTLVPGLDLVSAVFLPEFDEAALRPVTPAVKGTIDANSVDAWVLRARELARECDRLEMCDSHIGKVFAYAPADCDGTWPCQSVRGCIERVESQSLEHGLGLEIENRRGVYTVGATGLAERRIRDGFTEYANRIESVCPRTAGVLRAVAKSYELDAAERDGEGLRREFVD